MACLQPPPPYFFTMPGQAQAPGLFGKTEYRYHSRDGGPPNKGAPPSAPPAPAPSGPPPAYAAYGPFGFRPAPAPTPAQPGPFMLPPGPNGFPGAVCVPNAPNPAPAAPPGWQYWQAPPPPAPPAAPARAWSFPIPPPAPVQGARRAATWGPEPPVQGNRVKNNLLHLKDSGGVGHIASKYNATFHIFNENILDGRYTINSSKQFYITSSASEGVRAMTAAYSMPVEELIEQLDCITIALPDYPRNWIGVTEVIEIPNGNGWWEVGSTFYLGQEKTTLSIKEAWGFSIGEANESKPKWLVRIPGRQTGSGPH